MDERAEDPALSTSEGYRALYTIGRRLRVDVDDVVALIDEPSGAFTCETVEARAQEMRALHSILHAKLRDASRAPPLKSEPSRVYAVVSSHLAHEDLEPRRRRRGGARDLAR